MHAYDATEQRPLFPLCIAFLNFLVSCPSVLPHVARHASGIPGMNVANGEKAWTKDSPRGAAGWPGDDRSHFVAGLSYLEQKRLLLCTIGWCVLSRGCPV